MSVDELVIGRNAFSRCAEYLIRQHWNHIVLVADATTYEAAGAALINQLDQQSIKATVCLIEPDQNGDVKADEVSLVQALLAVDHTTDALLAVGSGTIHDITRFCSSKTDVPFLSVPTAPSVDGFTSVGAPLILKGRKITVKAVGPQALFADIDVLTGAPPAMIAAGFGDMMAKFTSLADWRFGQRTADEPYSEKVASMTQKALQQCVDHVDQIAARDEEGIRILLQALIESGEAMLLFGQSHPASGAEHHLSHYWEMHFIEKGRPQILHGAKVAAATVLIANVYEQFAAELQKSGADVPVPSSAYIAGLLAKVGAPVTPADLGIDEALVLRSLANAHTLRSRHTMLHYLNKQQTHYKKEVLYS